MAARVKSEAGSDQSLAALSLPRFGQTPPGPVIIAIEGPNGAGKTTLSWAMSRKLGVPWCLGTDEAWAAENLKVRMIRDAEWFASAMFFLSGCFEQMRLLRDRSEPLVIMDRSFWSTLAVHGATNVGHLQAILDMLRPIASSVQVPHFTLILEASFSTCQSRIATKTGTARALDQLTATAEFHQREAAFYQWLGTQCSAMSFLDVNAANADEVADQALEVVRKQFPGLVRG